MTLAPDVYEDAALALRLADDIADPDRGVLPAGKADLESPHGALFKDLLSERGWNAGERFTPLRRDLAAPVDDPGVRIEVVGPDLVADRTAVQRSAFKGSTFTDERWHAMASGPLYADARCLVAYDEDAAVGTVTVWSAGPGRPGLLEPMGVHAEHRGRGHGKAVNLAAAAVLREMGASSAIVCTPSANIGGVAAYKSAGYQALPEIGDLSRGA
nr:GNAT family N-acetyltransferase [Glycomyces sp. NRRL B-16210]